MYDGVGEVTETSDGGRIWRTAMEQHQWALAESYWSSQIEESGGLISLQHIFINTYQLAQME